MSEGLSLYSPRLAEACAQADPSGLRAMSEVGCRLALADTGLAGPEVSAAVETLLDGRFGDGVEREALAQVVEALDKQAFDLQDAVEEGAASEEAYLEAFRRARAASALLWALHADPQRAASNALYEAIAALDERPALLEPAVLAAGGHTG